jgi:Leucine-rich repeat (LRR) protein
MKAKFLFQRVSRVFLMIVMLGSFLAIPNQAVLAKPLSGTFTTCAAQTQIPAAECDALVALYNSTNGASWANRTGWLQTDTPCSWFGVTCGNGTNVTELYLHGNQLSGPIPTELDSLTQLTSLGLGDNQLTGYIPTQLGNLTQLQALHLYQNQLSGSIPTQLASLTNLTMLYLGNNQLSGSIPPELCNLINLTDLDLSGNQLSGSIPAQLGNLTQLTYLSLSWNQLTGSIPPELGNLTNLTGLSLGSNTLSGSIPPELCNLINLTDLDLSANQLSGSIPTQLGSLTNLQSLHLGNNQLTGSIPAGLSSLTKLAVLYFSYNALSGPIPAELGSLTNLTLLDLSANQLSGSIPTQLGNLTKLEMLNLSDNALTGRIPTQLGSLTKLTWLYLGNNQLTGEIPASIVHLTQLTDLTLSCGLASSNPVVIAFINVLIPGWQNNLCLPVVTLKSVGAQDGWILEWSETGNVGGAMNAIATTFNIGDNAAKRQYRGILSFSTGAGLPDTAVITKVILKVKKSAILGGGNPVAAFGGFMVDIKKGPFGAAALQASDFQAAAGIAGKSCGPFNTALVGGWYSIDLTGAKGYVNKLATASGLTQIRLRFGLDDNNNAVANVLSLYSGNAPAANRPQLVVTYYVP